MDLGKNNFFLHDVKQQGIYSKYDNLYTATRYSAITFSIETDKKLGMKNFLWMQNVSSYVDFFFNLHLLLFHFIYNELYVKIWFHYFNQFCIHM